MEAMHARGLPPDLCRDTGQQSSNHLLRASNSRPEQLPYSPGGGWSNTLLAMRRRLVVNRGPRPSLLAAGPSQAPLLAGQALESEAKAFDWTQIAG
ncbi:predicted protein [Chaetomium globosum CBS 148.51]|uniref:Uncharacterized protein n=1 Tax=Chaetomium globosum (strain ATCC 6205 / CBS 148.51 / DSM 1962 / NBRC 6347 / NRRL 1970) TaxID=306901 RepID=Q2GN20_CHAGB|nr:uncharacterized protein CHGG_10634 [Chaetomium globosum CBS 148.51]EAQ84230.1 predicted protein [Chaetomium globosum CBS 148.51]